MTKSTRRQLPSYRLHRPSGQAVVTLNGRDHYLGPHGSPESRAEYDRLLVLYLAHGRELPASEARAFSRRHERDEPESLTIAELIHRFLEHCDSEYRRADGSASREIRNVELAARPLFESFPDLPALEFGPKALRAYMELLVDRGLTRNTVNQRAGIVRRMFKWAVAQELLPGNAYEALRAVDGLKRGRSRAHDCEPVRPVPVSDVEATLPHLSGPVAAMVELQLRTGMRPGEIVQMRPCDLDRPRNADGVWEYRPAQHKNDWRGHERVVPLGPECQRILAPFLHERPDASPCFDPRERFARPSQAAHEAGTLPRLTRAPRHPGRQQKTARKVNDHYTTVTYAQAIRRACAKAGVTPWTPGRLRHTAAVRIREEMGLEAAQALLGHTLVETTQIYADTRSRKAREVAQRLG